MKKRYFLELAYTGKNYHGWQRQPGAVSIQEALEERMSLLLREKIELTTAGRTDAGVHAKQSFAHFDMEADWDLKLLKHRLNSFLPHDIAIQNIHRVTPTAHARYDALSRTYRYIIVTEKNPFMYDFAWHVREPLDLVVMQAASEILLQYENFRSFSKVKTDVKTYICHLSQAKWFQTDNHRMEFVITANRFLRNMVRAIVGTLVEVGKGKLRPESMHEIIQARNRNMAGPSAPPQGLYLEKVQYPTEIFI